LNSNRKVGFSALTIVAEAHIAFVYEHSCNMQTNRKYNAVLGQFTGAKLVYLPVGHSVRPEMERGCG